jgi:hypothetical protein
VLSRAFARRGVVIHAYPPPAEHRSDRPSWALTIAKPSRRSDRYEEPPGEGNAQEPAAPQGTGRKRRLAAPAHATPTLTSWLCRADG